MAGSLLGLALGDALGFVVEAQPPEAASRYVREWLTPGRPGARVHPTFGQYSDDTQLARELLASIRDAGRWDAETFARRIAALFGTGRDVGAGPGTRAAALQVWAGTPWEKAGTPAPYAGNGSAMRVGPLGLLFGTDVPVMRRVAAEQSHVTHADSRCAGASVAVAGAVALAARPGPIDRHGFLSQLSAWVAEENREVAEALLGLERWVDLSPETAARHVRDAGLDPYTPGEWQGISAFVLPSVAWALYAFLRSPDDYWTVVCTAIDVGGDTDTMAAMAGAMAGARSGPDALPAALLERVTDRGTWGAAELNALARHCAQLTVS
jgi:ADP-ribosylglycohydrolase